MKTINFLFLSALAAGVPSEHHDMAGSSDNSMVHSSDNSTVGSPSPMSMEHHHGMPALQNPHLEPQQRKYWENYNTTTYFNANEGNKFNLWSHAILCFTAFGLIAPLTLLLSTDPRSQWLYVPLQTLQSALAIGSYFFLWFFSGSAPKLYAGNAYSGFTVAMFVISSLHWTSMIVKAISSYLTFDESYNPINRYMRPSARRGDAASYSLQEDPEAYAMDEIHTSRENSMESTEYSVGSDTEISSFDTDCNVNARKAKNSQLHDRSPPSALVQKLAKNRFFVKINALMGGFSGFIFNTLNFPLFVLGWAYMLTGLATGFLMGKDFRVFALLAHFIKGWVFFALGFIELARFFGAGASRGWAWNEVLVRPSSAAHTGISRILHKLWPEYPSIEFVQSFLIFFYGSTNVFLEHLGNTDGVWTHKDLQHASIAFMFFGGGLCGLILESGFVKQQVSAAFGFGNENESSNALIRRSFSINPMPAFTIFWTGALMSHHQQETELATQIHMQWGYLFSLAAVLRLITFALMLTKPRAASEVESSQPQRPFTEILVSFCLICGGMIFMSSNRETVEGMIYRGIDQMFTMNVSVGITVLLMSYFTCCLTVKGWADSRY